MRKAIVTVLMTGFFLLCPFSINVSIGGVVLTFGQGLTPEFGKESTSATLQTRTRKSRDPDLILSLETVLSKLRDKEAMVLVDVRAPEAFQKLRIPGSINIPLFAIKTKGFLREKTVVVVSEGYGYRPIDQACASLRHDGYDVWILHGGLNLWKERGEPLEGDPFAQKELNKVPPDAFFADRDYGDRVVIYASGSNASEALRLIPQAIHLPYREDPKAFVSKLRAARSEHVDNPLLSVLILDETGEDYTEIETLMPKRERANTFYLIGGLEGYKAFLTRQARIWAPDEKPSRGRRKCQVCP
jgi:rhodanese-related sulfurtransferase